MSSLRPEQVLRILQVTDAFSIHREAVYIPLMAEENGSVTLLADGRLRIVCPRVRSFEEWLTELRSVLDAMDLSKVKH